MSTIEISKFIALILRHKPEAIGIALDKNGWASVDELIKGVNKTHCLTAEMLDKIVYGDDKRRYSFNEDKTKIRANQGHSVNVDVELKRAIPPTVLYHGTGEKYVLSIDGIGLIPKTRLYVHLSADYGTALKVGARHGRAVVYAVDTANMIKDGYVFYISENGVWLTESVPVKYLKRSDG